MTASARPWRALEHGPGRVLAIDDDPLQRLMIGEILEAPDYAVTVAEDARAGLAQLRTREFDLVLLDRRLPDLSGDEVCRRIRAEPGPTQPAVLMVTGDSDERTLAAALQAGADDVVRKPYLPSELRARVAAALRHRRARDLIGGIEALLLTLARLVDAREPGRQGAGSRLARSSAALGRALGLSAPDLEALHGGSLLHDIGMLAVSDAILLKPGALDDGERAQMRHHTVIGAALTQQLDRQHPALPIVRHHHERWDGSGYPDGLAGEAIPLLARVFQVVDVYDALVHARPYRPPMPPAQALGLLVDEAARGWRDPQIVAVFATLQRGQPERPPTRPTPPSPGSTP